MADLYPSLLKNPENISFGVKLIDVISLEKQENQGEQVMGTKKLLITYDGDVYDSIDCQSITIKLDTDVVAINIITSKNNDNQSPKIEDIPQAEAIIPAVKDATYELQGDDLEAFENMSDFRRDINQIVSTEPETLGGRLELCTLESATFNIQDLNSVQNAILDIMDKEKHFIDNEYKVFKINTPTFIYEDGDNFKLIEAVTLISQKTAIVEENK